MKTIYHLCTDENNQPLDAAFVDGNGRKWVIPYDAPIEFESDFLAGRIVEHLQYYGMVEVEVTKTRAGLQYNMDDATARAKQSLEVSEKACINDYIMGQLQDRVQKNFPPLPPSGRALQCIVKHKTNLLKYGIRPVGWEPPFEMEDVGAVTGTPLSQPNAAMEERVRMLETALLQQTQMINQLLTGKLNAPPAPPQTVTPATPMVADEELGPEYQAVNQQPDEPENEAPPEPVAKGRKQKVSL